jgi:hypothetical protein
MKCPYLFDKNNVRLCESMEEAGMDGKVSDFDVEHYCDGTPVNCFYFRNANKLKQPTFTIVSKNL